MSRERIINFLTHGASQRISFSFVSSSRVTVTVDHTTFERVANAIRSGRVRLEETTSFTQGIGAEYLAQGNRHHKANTLRVPPHRGRFDEGGLIHESVHASFDLTLSGGVNAAEEEAASYIAEYIYYCRTGLSPKRIVQDAITLAAQPIANAVIRRQPITSTQIAALANAVTNHPTYASMPAGPYQQDG